MGPARGKRVAIAGAALIAGAAALFPAGCSLITSFDGFGGGAQTVTASCPIARWPAPPGKDDGPGDVTMAAALTYLGLSGPNGNVGGPFGYDLDGWCTCPDRGSCKNPIDAGQAPCDQAGGRDNNFGALVKLLAQYGGIDEVGINTNLTNGKYGVVLRVDHYNGLANDSKVSVALYDAVSVVGGGAPRGDGTDEWILDTNSLEGPQGVVPHYHDDNAYVTDGTLVASLPRFELRASTAPDNILMPFDVAAVHLSAHISGAKGQLDVDRGVLAGRIPLATLENVAAIRGICDTTLTQRLEQTACGLQDIASDPSHDKTGDFLCDALSASIFFTAVHSQVSTKAEPRDPGANQCGDAGVRPSCL